MKNVLICLTAVFAGSTAFGVVDAWDPADNSAGSGSLIDDFAAVEQSHGPHTLEGYGDEDPDDWFRVELMAGLRYRFETTGTADLEANLYSSANLSSWMVYDGDSGDGLNPELIFVPPSNGTYYLNLQNYGNSEGLEYAAYTLLYQVSPVLDEWDPVDDVYSNAWTLVPEAGELIHGPHYLSETDVVDWFHFNLASNTVYTFEAIGGWDTVGTLYYGNPDNQVAENDNAYVEGDEYWNFSMTYTNTMEGDYYLKVVNWDAGADLEYSLRYRISGEADSDGDGMSDNAEAVAGTNPTNPASYFSITNWSVGSFTIEWKSVHNRQYQVYRTDSLTNAFEPVGPTINYPQNSYTDNSAASDQYFYKVEVQLK